MRDQRAKSPAMSADAYAGFLKLLLTPVSRVPTMSPDLAAYLRYVSERESHPADLPDSTGSSTLQAA